VIVEVGAGIAAIVTLLWLFFGPAITDLLDGDDVRLEVSEVTVSNRAADYRLVGSTLRQTAETEPTVEATVRNLGKDTAWIEEARITVRDSARLSGCVYGGGGGDVARTKRYRITLPEYEGVGNEVVKRDLHVEVEAGRGVRPVLSFQSRDFLVAHLYAIHVELVAGPSGRLLNLGDFVIGVPEPVSRSGQALPENETLLTSESAKPYRVVSTWCYRHNLAAVRRLLAYDGERVARVRALEHLQPAPVWARYVDDRPARLAVWPLLRSTVVDAPMFAVFAAERSGEPVLEKKVRERAAALLERRARDQMDEYARGAVADAERLLSLQPSNEGRRLLWEAKARLEAEEEKAEEEAEGLVAAP
jgi:hypothetical protein